MKRLPQFLLLALGALGLAGCQSEIDFNSSANGTVVAPSPPNVNVHQNRKDTVLFKNNDDRIHRIAVWAGTGAMPAATTATIIYPPGSGATRPDSLTWAIPAAASPPAPYTWQCLTHPAETGTINVKP